jgi:glycerophosphoryl diester phosphodiesterase
VVHDWSLDRLAGSPVVVETSTWEELRPLRLLAPDGKPSDAHLPQLEEVFGAVPETLPINVELKCRRSDPDAFLNAVCPLLDQRERCWVSSFEWNLLHDLRRRRPDLELAPLTSRRRRGFERTAHRLHAVALHCAVRALSDALLRRARRADLPVLVYSVDDTVQAESLFERGVSGVFTNEPRRLRSRFRRSP